MNTGEWAILLVTVVFVGVPLALGAYRYVNVRNAEREQQEFENYHTLIRWLVKGQQGDDKPWLDSQLAVIFELRRYRKYRQVTVRILEGLATKWVGDSDIETYKKERYFTEIWLTLSDLALHNPLLSSVITRFRGRKPRWIHVVR